MSTTLVCTFYSIKYDNCIFMDVYKITKLKNRRRIFLKPIPKFASQPRACPSEASFGILLSCANFTGETKVARQTWAEFSTLEGVESCGVES